MDEVRRPVVLLVEDNAFIRVTAAEALFDCGFTVLEADSAHDAMRVLTENELVDVLFTDLNLPGSTDGLKLSKMVDAVRPGTKLVVTSGQQELTSTDLPDHGVFLSKPYGQDQMCNVIRSQLNRQ